MFPPCHSAKGARLDLSFCFQYRIAMTSRNTLRQLLAIINTGVASIEKAYSEADIPLPNLDELYTPNNVEESVASTIILVVAAASQLISTLRNPGQLLYEQSFAVSQSTSQTHHDAHLSLACDVLCCSGHRSEGTCSRIYPRGRSQGPDFG